MKTGLDKETTSSNKDKSTRKEKREKSNPDPFRDIKTICTGKTPNKPEGPRSRVANIQINHPYWAIPGAVLFTSVLAGVIAGLMFNPAISNAFSPIKNDIDDIISLDSNYVDQCTETFSSSVNPFAGSCYYNTTSIMDNALDTLQKALADSAVYSVLYNFNPVAFAMGFAMTATGEIGAIWAMWVMLNAFYNGMNTVKTNELPTGRNPLYEKEDGGLGGLDYLREENNPLTVTTDASHKRGKKNKTLTFGSTRKKPSDKSPLLTDDSNLDIEKTGTKTNYSSTSGRIFSPVVHKSDIKSDSKDVVIPINDDKTKKMQTPTPGEWDELNDLEDYFDKVSATSSKTNENTNKNDSESSEDEIPLKENVNKFKPSGYTS